MNKRNFISAFWEEEIAFYKANKFYKAFKTSISTISIAKMTLTQKRKNENEIEIENKNDEVLYPNFMVCFLDC